MFFFNGFLSKSQEKNPEPLVFAPFSKGIQEMDGGGASGIFLARDMGIFFEGSLRGWFYMFYGVFVGFYGYLEGSLRGFMGFCQDFIEFCQGLNEGFIAFSFCFTAGRCRVTPIPITLDRDMALQKETPQGPQVAGSIFPFTK